MHRNSLWVLQISADGAAQYFVHALSAADVCSPPECAIDKADCRKSQPVTLQYDLAVASNDDTQTAGGGFDGTGNAMPAEMLPSKIKYHDVEFDLAPAKTGTPNAVVAKGQTIALPEGQFNRIYILAASADGDQKATFQVGNAKVDLNIQDWTGFIGQWDTRLWKNQTERDWAISANHAVWPPADLRRARTASCLSTLSRRLCRAPAGICETSEPCMVRIPPAHCRWTQPALSVLLSLRVCSRRIRESENSQAPEQRQNSYPCDF